MNTNVLSKCLEELKKESPDLSYIRGMLETLLDMSEATTVSMTPIQVNQTGTYVDYTKAFPVEEPEPTDAVTAAYLGGATGTGISS